MTAASPDLVSAGAGVSFYVAGMPHFNQGKGRTFIWSRRLHRLLQQEDVFGHLPDRTLRRLALSLFDNRDNLQEPGASDGLPLAWDHASIGPDGITWSFAPYGLGGYAAAGEATIGWSALKPYLRRDLPFVIEAIHPAPPVR